MYATVPHGVFGKVPVALRVRFVDQAGVESVVMSPRVEVAVKGRHEASADAPAPWVVHGTMVQISGGQNVHVGGDEVNITRQQAP